MDDEEDQLPERTVFKDDVLETKPLAEEDFIQESPPPQGSFPWLWLALPVLLLLLILGGINSYSNWMGKRLETKPFLEVTNREMSLFLWQFPSYMRVHAKNKTGYLPGFKYSDRIGLDITTADQLVVAPPDLLFLYHTWHRLLYSAFIPRPIPIDEFIEFLNSAEEWDPKYWKGAPDGYKKLINDLTTLSGQDLQQLPETDLPLVVKRAFQGWKNYFKEGKQINQIQVTLYQIENFLSKYPHYARSYWRNIQSVAGQEVAGNDYLQSTLQRNDPSIMLTEREVPSFLRAALFNWMESEKYERISRRGQSE